MHCCGALLLPIASLCVVVAGCCGIVLQCSAWSRGLRFGCGVLISPTALGKSAAVQRCGALQCQVAFAHYAVVWGLLRCIAAARRRALWLPAASRRCTHFANGTERSTATLGCAAFTLCFSTRARPTAVVACSGSFTHSRTSSRALQPFCPVLCSPQNSNLQGDRELAIVEVVDLA